MHISVYYPNSFDFHPQFLDYHQQVLINGFNQSIPLWVIIWWMWQDDAMVETQCLQIFGSEILGIICHYFCQDPKSCYYLILKELNHNLLSCSLGGNRFNPPCEIICSYNYQFKTIAWILFEFFGEVQSPLLKKCLHYHWLEWQCCKFLLYSKSLTWSTCPYKVMHICKNTRPIITLLS